MAFPKRVDRNQKDLVTLWRSVGVSVLILSEVGKGCPDLLLGVNGVNILVEVKDGEKPPSARKLTPDEQKFFDNWRGQICVITNEAEAVDLINTVRGQ